MKCPTFIEHYTSLKQFHYNLQNLAQKQRKLDKNDSDYE